MGGITRVWLSISFTLVLFSFFSLFLFLHFPPCLQLVIGRFAVSLASVFVRYRQGEWRPGKKTGFGVTFTHVSDTYHLLHQINMASECVCVCVGVPKGSSFEFISPSPPLISSSSPSFPFP